MANKDKCKTAIYVRDLTCDDINIIALEKAVMLSNNPGRTTISDSAAILRLIRRAPSEIPKAKKS
jgi:hypothetical protein